VRDQIVPGFLNSLNNLAGQFAAGFNAAQAQGYNSSGAAGQAFFTIPSTGSAAAGISVALPGGSQIAASSDGSPGSNGNVANLTGVETQPVVGGQSPTDYYSGIVSTVGNDVSNGSAELSAAQAILTQLQDQNNSVAGVSINEEAANMVQYQNAYDAAAQVVTAINDMLYTVINMGNLTE